MSNNDFQSGRHVRLKRETPASVQFGKFKHYQIQKTGKQNTEILLQDETGCESWCYASDFEVIPYEEETS